jgi:hypothetical protein
VMCFKDFQSILQISDHVHRGIWENFEIWISDSPYSPIEVILTMETGLPHVITIN